MPARPARTRASPWTPTAASGLVSFRKLLMVISPQQTRSPRKSSGRGNATLDFHHEVSKLFPPLNRPGGSSFSCFDAMTIHANWQDRSLLLWADNLADVAALRDA